MVHPDGISFARRAFAEDLIATVLPFLSRRERVNFDQFVSSRWNFGNSRAYPRSMDIIAASATDSGMRERY